MIAAESKNIEIIKCLLMNNKIDLNIDDILFNKYK